MTDGLIQVPTMTSLEEHPDAAANLMKMESGDLMLWLETCDGSASHILRRDQFENLIDEARTLMGWTL